MILRRLTRNSKWWYWALVPLLSYTKEVAQCQFYILGDGDGVRPIAGI